MGTYTYLFFVIHFIYVLVFDNIFMRENFHQEIRKLLHCFHKRNYSFVISDQWSMVIGCDHINPKI